MILLSPDRVIELPVRFEVDGEHDLILTVRYQESCSKPHITMSTSVSQSKFVNFQEVKASVNITQVLDHYGLLESLKREPSGYAGPCPFCDSSSPRPFRASEEKNCFNCLSCKTGGNVLDFVKVYEDCTIREGALLLQDWFNLETKAPSRRKASNRKATSRQSSRPVSAKPKEPSPKPLGFTLELDSEHEWFEQVGIEPATVAEFGLGFCAKGVLEGCIAFPVHNQDHQLLGYIGYELTADPQPPEWQWRTPKQLDVSGVVFNASRTDPTGEGELVLATDPVDLVIRWQDGEKRVVALLGDTISATHVKILESLV